MIGWELKKIGKSKTSIIALIFMILLIVQGVFIKPMLETQNEYYDDENNTYVVDHRPEKEIAEDKLKVKVEALKEITSMDLNEIKDTDTKIIEEAKIKLKKDKGEKYEDIAFYQVFGTRVTGPLATLLIAVIIVTLASNIYTDEKISNVSPIILASKAKRKVLYSKLFTLIMIPIVTYGLYAVIVYFITMAQYGAPVNGGLQAYRIFIESTIVNEMSITRFILGQIGIDTIVFLAISIFTGLFSFIGSNSVQTVSASLIFIVIGKALSVLKFLPNTLLKLLGQGNFVAILGGESFVGRAYMGTVSLLGKNIELTTACIGGIVIIILIGLVLNVFTIEKGLNR